MYIEVSHEFFHLYKTFKNMCTKILEQRAPVHSDYLSGWWDSERNGAIFHLFYIFLTYCITFMYLLCGSKTKCGLFMHTSKLLPC